MAKIVRVTLLLIVLLAVAQGAWKAHVRTSDWSETLRVAVYPVNAGASPAADSYIGGLRRPVIEPLAVFLREQARGYNLRLAEPIEVYLAPRVNAVPPAPPRNGSAAEIVWWSLQMRWWAWRHDGFDGPRPHVRVFVLYHAPAAGLTLPHSTGLRAGMIVLANAFAGADNEGGNNVVIAHELLHTFGATDKYDPATNLPLYPEGYAEPNAVPLFPQRRAEIMGGRIPLSRSEAEIPRSLDQTTLGAATAHEINWLK